MDTLKYCLLGNVDAAKSTLIGVLKTGELDDGKGKSRATILQMKHEKQSGNTTNSNLVKIYNKDKKSIQLIDLPGHSRYFAMTLRGMMEYNPSYAIVIVSAHKGITESIKSNINNKGHIVQNMTKIHLQVCAFLRIPFIVIISKIDNCPEDRLALTIKEVKEYIKKMGIKDFYPITKLDALKRAKEAYNKDYASQFVPYFMISNVTGVGIDLLKDFLFDVPFRQNLTKQLIALKDFCTTNKVNKVFEIYKSYYVKGIGIVVFGCLKVGTISKGDQLIIGPFGTRFTEIRVRSLHNDERREINILGEGDYGCLAITSMSGDQLDKHKLNKGKIITDTAVSSSVITTECKIAHHHTTITSKFNTFIHTGIVGTPAKVLEADKFPIRSGDLVNITFSLSNSQFVYPGMKFVFRDDGIKGHGIIKSIK